MLTNTSRPQAECGGDLFDYGFAVFYLGEENPIAPDFLDTGIGQHLNAIACKPTLL